MRHNRVQAVYVDRKPDTPSLRTQLRQVIRAIVTDRPLGEQFENGLAIAGIVSFAGLTLLAATILTTGP